MGMVSRYDLQYIYLECLWGYIWGYIIASYIAICINSVLQECMHGNLLIRLYTRISPSQAFPDGYRSSNHKIYMVHGFLWLLELYTHI